MDALRAALAGPAGEPLAYYRCSGLIALAWPWTVRVSEAPATAGRNSSASNGRGAGSAQRELNTQQRYLDHWLLRLQRHLDSRRYLWQLPYMVIGPAGSGKTTLLREARYPSDTKPYAPEALRAWSSAGMLSRMRENRR